MPRKRTAAAKWASAIDLALNGYEPLTIEPAHSVNSRLVPPARWLLVMLCRGMAADEPDPPSLVARWVAEAVA